MPRNLAATTDQSPLSTLYGLAPLVDLAEPNPPARSVIGRGGLR
jgi:hypothetical protein